MGKAKEEKKVTKCPECGTETLDLGSGCSECPKCGKTFSV